MGVIDKLGRDLVFNIILILALLVIYESTLLAAAHVIALADKVQDFALGTITGGILTAIERGRSSNVAMSTDADADKTKIEGNSQ